MAAPKTERFAGKARLEMQHSPDQSHFMTLEGRGRQSLRLLVPSLSVHWDVRGGAGGEWGSKLTSNAERNMLKMILHCRQD